MQAMILHQIGKPLVLIERDDPKPGVGELRIKVEACAVCRTDLHVVDGDLKDPKLPLVPGHEIVGADRRSWRRRRPRKVRPTRQHSLAWPHMWKLPLLSDESGKPV